MSINLRDGRQDKPWQVTNNKGKMFAVGILCLQEKEHSHMLDSESQQMHGAAHFPVLRSSMRGGGGGGDEAERTFPQRTYLDCFLTGSGSKQINVLGPVKIKPGGSLPLRPEASRRYQHGK